MNQRKTRRALQRARREAARRERREAKAFVRNHLRRYTTAATVMVALGAVAGLTGASMALATIRGETPTTSCSWGASSLLVDDQDHVIEQGVSGCLP